MYLNTQSVVYSVVFIHILSKCKGQNVTHCNTTSTCNSNIEFSICKNHTCQCNVDHYIYEDDHIKMCAPCPGLGQYCSEEQCCMNSDYLICSGGICRCRNPYDGYYCWDQGAPDTSKLEFLAQFILGIGLIFALAILGSLIWRFCTRQDASPQTNAALQRDSSFSSLNSLQRLVLARLQDRPPPYNPGYQPWKYFNNSSISTNQTSPAEAPPPYTISGNQIPATLPYQGLENPAFSVEELRQDVAAALPVPSTNNTTESDNKPKTNH